MPSSSTLWKLYVTCARPLAAAVEAEIGRGAEAVTNITPPRKAAARVEALYKKKPKKSELNSLRIKLAILARAYKARTPVVRLEKTGGLDWLEKVAADHPPVRIARWTVYGGAHEKEVKKVKLKLRIDASSAFGTGEHPTTRGCLLLLDKMLKKGFGGKALDMGCGSGILALAFASATQEHAVAIDCDPEAVRIARLNAHLNKLDSLVKVARGDGYGAEAVRKNSPYGIVMANIFARPLCLMAEDLKRHLKPGGAVILSGMLNDQAESVLSVHLKLGFSLVERIRRGEWTALALTR